MPNPILPEPGSVVRVRAVAYYGEEHPWVGCLGEVAVARNLPLSAQRREDRGYIWITFKGRPLPGCCSQAFARVELVTSEEEAAWRLLEAKL